MKLLLIQFSEPILEPAANCFNHLGCRSRAASRNKNVKYGNFVLASRKQRASRCSGPPGALPRGPRSRPRRRLFGYRSLWTIGGSHHLDCSTVGSGGLPQSQEPSKHGIRSVDERLGLRLQKLVHFVVHRYLRSHLDLPMVPALPIANSSISQAGKDCNCDSNRCFVPLSVIYNCEC